MDDHPDSDQTQARIRHEAFAELLRGERAMRWSDWLIPILDSHCLTAHGIEALRWAVTTLQRSFGEPFLARVPGSHPILSLGFWPINDVPWVYTNILQLSAEIELIRTHPATQLSKILREARKNLEPINFIHMLLQLELAGIGLREGWSILFEPPLQNRRKADIQLSSSSSAMVFEMVTMRQSMAEHTALEHFHQCGNLLQQIAWETGVHISGTLDNPGASPEELSAWVYAFRATAETVKVSGDSCQVPGLLGGAFELHRAEDGIGTVNLESAPVAADIWNRLVARLNDKNRQAADGGPVWVRMEEFAGLWPATSAQGMDLQGKLEFLAPNIQYVLPEFPNVAGVILSPAVLPDIIGLLPDQSFEVVHSCGRAVRCSLPGHRMRETILVAQPGTSQKEISFLVEWYMQEKTWLNWALKQLHLPDFNALFSGE